MGKVLHIDINSDYIKLEQFLKLIDLVSSGGEAKLFILNNDILVNNIIEKRRGRKLYKEDQIFIDGQLYKIC